LTAGGRSEAIENDDNVFKKILLNKKTNPK
jgi:hypothetical protein